MHISLCAYECVHCKTVHHIVLLLCVLEYLQRIRSPADGCPSCYYPISEKQISFLLS
jgi:hypothetical protein